MLPRAKILLVCRGRRPSEGESVLQPGRAILYASPPKHAGRHGHAISSPSAPTPYAATALTRRGRADVIDCSGDTFSRLSLHAVYMLFASPQKALAGVAFDSRRAVFF